MRSLNEKMSQILFPLATNVILLNSKSIKNGKVLYRFHQINISPSYPKQKPILLTKINYFSTSVQPITSLVVKQECLLVLCLEVNQLNFFFCYTIHKERKSTRKIPKRYICNNSCFQHNILQKKVCHVHWKGKKDYIQEREMGQKTFFIVEKLKVTFTTKYVSKGEIYIQFFILRT